MYIYCCTKIKEVGLLTVYNIVIDRIFTICGRILNFYISLGIQRGISPQIDSQMSSNPGFRPYIWQWVKAEWDGVFQSAIQKLFH
jgi:hypothetical protein